MPPRRTGVSSDRAGDAIRTRCLNLTKVAPLLRSLTGIVESTRIELATYSLQSYRSPS